MNSLFAFPPPQPPAPPPSGAPRSLCILSERIEVPSPSTGRPIEYARLSDADHREVRNTILALWQHRDDIRQVLDRPSGLYGSRGGGKAQTFSDILRGLYDKMHQRHPMVHGRVGRDLTIKQMGELNRMIDALNVQFGAGIDPVGIP